MGNSHAFFDGERRLLGAFLLGTPTRPHFLASSSPGEGNFSTASGINAGGGVETRHVDSVPGSDSGPDKEVSEGVKSGHVFVTKEPVLLGHVDSEAVASEGVEFDLDVLDLRLDTGTAVSDDEFITLDRNVDEIHTVLDSSVVVILGQEEKHVVTQFVL